MNTLQYATQHIRAAIYPIIGDVEVKNFFSYYALFKENLMFGLYKNQQFYLRISSNAFKHTPWVAELSRLTDPNMGIHHKYFYHIPSSLLPRAKEYAHLLQETLQEIATEKRENELMRKKQIRSLPNLNINIERVLRRFGIFTIEDLYSRGAIPLFVEMIKVGMDIDQNMLFRLHGAINRQHIYTFTPKQKLELMTEADQALYDAGLRKRFIKNRKS